MRDFETREENYATARLGINYEQKLFERGTLSDTAVFFANLNERGEFRFTNELAFVTPLADKLDLRVALESEFDSLAQDQGLEQWDHTLTTGISYSF